MTQEFIPYQQALELKELGFDEPCLGHYWENLFYFETTFNHPSTMPNSPESCLAPTFSQAFRWFREKQYYSEITTECTQADGSIGFSWRIWKPWLIEEWSPENGNDEWSYKTYEEAELACLNRLIEIVKTKQL
jgi:hypothetical protein